MSGPAGVLYSQPTEFGRSINGIDGVWGSNITNNSTPFASSGGGNPFSGALPGLGGTSSYNQSRGPALGAYDQTNFALMLDGEQFQDHRSSSKQYNFVTRNGGIAQDTMGMSSWNHQARYNAEWVDAFGGSDPDAKSPNAVLDRWNPYGSPIGNTTEDLRDVGEKTQGFHIGKRARIWNIGAAINNHVVRLGDYVFLLLRRYEEVDEIANLFGAPSLPFGAKAAAKKVSYYWQFDPYFSDDRTMPPSTLYTNSIGNGVCFFIGTVSGLYGTSTTDASVVATARETLHPKADNTGYLNTLKAGFEIDVQLGMAM